MIKICFVTTVSITLKSFLVETAKYMHEQGDFEITFICSPDEEFQSTLPGFIRFIPVKMGRGINADGIGAIKELVYIFKREKFDIVQYSTPNASCYAAIAAKIAKIPVRLYCQWGMAYVGFDGLKRRIFKAIEKMVCTLSTWVEPDSNSNLNFAHSEKLYPEDKGSVIWNGSACGVNLNKFDISKKELHRKEIRDRYQLEKDAFVYGFVGRITRDKGINELFECFQSIVSKYPNSYLMMVGPSEVDETVKKELYDWAANSPQVIFTGYVNTVERYLSAMDCYVLPSYREGFGMGIVEAEAMGVPVIVTRIPGPIDAMVEDKTGIVVEKKDIQSLKNAMIRMQQEMTQCMKMGDEGHQYVKNNFEQKKLLSYIMEDRRQLIHGA